MKFVVLIIRGTWGILVTQVSPNKAGTAQEHTQISNKEHHEVTDAPSNAAICDLPHGQLPTIVKSFRQVIFRLLLRDTHSTSQTPKLMAARASIDYE